MDASQPLAGPARRLAEELEEDGVRLSDDPVLWRLVVEELDYARRIPVFEGRRPLYGSMVVPPDRSLRASGNDLDLLDVDLDLDDARRFADGRSSYLVRRPGSCPRLACFDRLLQYEADLVRLQEASGAAIVQRTAVLGATRLFTDGVVTTWDGRSWQARPTATAVLPALRTSAPELRPEVASGVLDLAVHWLAPARIGATLVVHDELIEWEALDTTTATSAPALWVTDRRHFPALFAALLQHDLAAVVTLDGRVELIGVGLRVSAEAEQAVASDRGMRHRSAQRFSFDHPSTTLVVVSEDGPVTIFRGGESLALAEPLSDAAGR